ncbi:hypothetical protein D3C80_1458890 [compost metagenome]
MQPQPPSAVALSSLNHKALPNVAWVHSVEHINHFVSVRDGILLLSVFPLNNAGFGRETVRHVHLINFDQSLYIKTWG